MYPACGCAYKISIDLHSGSSNLRLFSTWQELQYPFRLLPEELLAALLQLYRCLS
jgi:hypothetical protein